MWHAGRLLGCGALSLFYLDEVHNVMHGDMKPENLVVTPVERLVPAGTDGRVGVVAGGGFVMSNVDTGSAAVLDASITRCPPPVTAEYLAPEAWRGLLRSGRLFTAKVDIWAVRRPDRTHARTRTHADAPAGRPYLIRLARCSAALHCHHALPTNACVK